MTLRLFGIRHHGPGCARALRDAFDSWRPDAVLVELPADCQAALKWIGDTDLIPPVAMLGWVLDQPQRAAFLPFAEFSPEWCALRWASANDVEMRAIDLPLAVSLSGDDRGELALGADRPIDPLAALAAAAGDTDPERWWDDVVEHQRPTNGMPADPFAAIADAMAAVRGGADTVSDTLPLGERRREAHMRNAIRRCQADGFQRIAVVCGAWHVPALGNPMPTASADTATLRGMPKCKVGVSWVPWTHRRLASASGYRAGVASPGWYAHLFDHAGDDRLARWFVSAARLLRRRGTDVSPDHLIAASRAATALAALRGRPQPGLDEVLDASAAVLTDGGGMLLIHDQLIVGPALGHVPDHAPQVPLARDLAAQQRAVRLKPEADDRVVELDVRTTSGRNRSVLLHRLAALGVPWGRLETGRGSSGTFRETWRVHWEPELAIRLVELAAHGTTVATATAHRLNERVAASSVLADVVGALDAALLGDVADVVGPAVARLEQLAAGDSDIGQLIDTLTPLAHTIRYGDVRGTDASAVKGTFDGIVIRVLAGVVGACRSLDDAAAAAMTERISALHSALALCDHAARDSSWPDVLDDISTRVDVHGTVQGRATRLLHDGGAWDAMRVERRMSRALTPGTEPATGAAFVEGFLAGSGTVLVHDRDLLGVIDRWIASLSPDAFVDIVPLLRRTFGSFDIAERRQLGLLVAGHGMVTPPSYGIDIDPDRAAAAMVTVRHLLAVPS